MRCASKRVVGDAELAINALRGPQADLWPARSRGCRWLGQASGSGRFPELIDAEQTICENGKVLEWIPTARRDWTSARDGQRVTIIKRANARFLHLSGKPDRSRNDDYI